MKSTKGEGKGHKDHITKKSYVDEDIERNLTITRVQRNKGKLPRDRKQREQDKAHPIYLVHCSALLLRPGDFLLLNFPSSPLNFLVLYILFF